GRYDVSGNQAPAPAADGRSFDQLAPIPGSPGRSGETAGTATPAQAPGEIEFWLTGVRDATSGEYTSVKIKGPETLPDGRVIDVDDEFQFDASGRMVFIARGGDGGAGASGGNGGPGGPGRTGPNQTKLTPADRGADGQEGGAAGMGTDGADGA